VVRITLTTKGKQMRDVSRDTVVQLNDRTAKPLHAKNNWEPSNR
jgi:hypothetical protein